MRAKNDHRRQHLPCPHWPPPDDAPIGVDAARDIVAWIADAAPPVLAEAERMMRERYPGITPTRHAATVGQLATWTLTNDMSGLAVGAVVGEEYPMAFVIVDIVLTRDGRLVARPGLRVRG